MKSDTTAGSSCHWGVFS